jgi:DNA-binding NarL/FixJ family response regulator
MTLEEATDYALSEEEPAPSVSFVAEQGAPSGGTPFDLTRREKEVAALLTRGFTNARIATELVISERTVATHIRNILKKLNVRSRERVAARMAERMTEQQH